MFLSLTLCALLIEAVFGYPDALFRCVGHPVTWIGRLITSLERRLNRPHTFFHARALGLLALVMICAIPVGITLAAQSLFRHLLPENICFGIEALFASTLIAQRALYQHVRAVLTGLVENGLVGGRHAVSKIVGRDPETLDRAGVVRAAIESLAENFSDGVVAPVFWLLVFGLPGIVAYKAINTADSMIGHLSPRHRDFGRAAALCDDCVNIPASRLTALWICMAAFLSGNAAGGALRAIRRDAARHRSPNAGWPEAAMAGALALRLAGPRQYDGIMVVDSWMGDGKAEAGEQDLAKALRLYRLGCLIQAICLLSLLTGVRT